jgi:murein L,D-transpeptidase YcbB/YkuD
MALAQAGAPAVKPAAAAAQPKPVAAQPAAPQQGVSQQVMPQPVPQAATPEAAPALPPPPPPPVWTMVDANQLLLSILTSAKEGLDPRDYDSAGLISAMRSNDLNLISAASTERFNKLSSDMALGHVRGADRQNWHIPDPDLDAARQDSLLRAALAQHRVGEALAGLLPSHPQYAALKKALEITPKTETMKVDRIRLNMDRWRWLPRDLGERYIIVNVPAYTAALVEDGVTVSRHRAVAGAIKTQTPQLMAMATGVILNPWWEVPPSISKEVAGKPGYVALKGADGKIQRWRQPPGPRNALGQIKFVMYNPHNIYLHDTNARSRFSSRMRALSHGCIRTEHIMDLATELLGDDGGQWTPGKIQAQLATGKTKQANFVKPVPVYIVYFSEAALNDGKIVDYQDLYGRDGKAMAALNMKDGGASLSVPKPKPQQVAAK